MHLVSDVLIKKLLDQSLKDMAVQENLLHRIFMVGKRIQSPFAHNYFQMLRIR